MSGTRRRDLARLAVAGGLGAFAWPAVATQPAASTAAQGANEVPNPSRPRIGLALGAGSARGFAHIGVLKSLDQAGIKPDVVVGTSAGALVGAFYAAGYSPWQIETVALNAKEVELADVSSTGSRGMLVGDSLWRFVNDALKGARIEALRTRLAVVATDLRSGDGVVLRNGVVADAVRASCSIPGVFIPRELAGRELVDGGLVSPLPVKVARQMGCDVVIAVDVGTRPNGAALSGVYEIVLQSFEIMGRALAEHEAQFADIVVRPDTSSFGSSNFGARRELIQSGYEATQRALPDLKRRIERLARPRKT
jgi:NTE family protein